MAELVVKVGADGTYSDGDILCAFDSVRVACCHAQHICHPRHEPLNGDGLRIGGLSRQYLDCVYQYRFERVNETEVNRIETDYLGTVIGQELFGPATMDVAEYLKRRKRHPKHRIFGAAGAEIWHGGKTDVSDDAVALLWTKIQTDSDHINAAGNCPHCGQDHSMWSVGRLDVRHFLCCQVDDFKRDEAEKLTEPHEATFGAREKITDADGNTVRPKWQDNQWQHPTGGWIYTKDPETGEVSVQFRKRKVKLDGWERDVLPQISKTANEVKDRSQQIGRSETLTHLDRAPWQQGRADVYKTLDHALVTGQILRDKKEDQTREIVKRQALAK